MNSTTQRAVKLAFNAIRFAANSQKGERYERNEDAFLVLPEWNVFAVADGMGGHNGGAVASNMVVNHIVSRLGACRTELTTDFIVGVITEANEAVYHKAQEAPELKGMGTTLSLVYFSGDSLTLFHVGDSRVYRHHEFRATQLTRDHVPGSNDLGVMVNEHTSQRGITRAVGVRKNIEVEVSRHQHEPETEYLVVSDGITDKLANYEISNVMSDVSLSLAKRIDKLIDLANQSGGTDDKTAILLAPQDERL